MSMDPELQAMLNQTIYVATVSSVNAYGERTWGTPASRDARVEEEERIVHRDNGDEVKTTHRIYVETAITKSDGIWLPGDSQADATLRREVLQAHPLPDEDGSIHHYEVMV